MGTCQNLTFHFINNQTLPQQRTQRQLTTMHASKFTSLWSFVQCAILLVIFISSSSEARQFPFRGEVIPVDRITGQRLHVPRHNHQSIDVPVHGVMKFHMGVSDQVVEGMRAEKYRVNPMSYWPDGTKVTQEAAPYILVGVPK